MNSSGGVNRQSVLGEVNAVAPKGRWVLLPGAYKGRIAETGSSLETGGQENALNTSQGWYVSTGFIPRATFYRSEPVQGCRNNLRRKLVREVARRAVPVTVTVCSPSPRRAEPGAACPGHEGCGLLPAPCLGRLLTVAGQFYSLRMLVFKTRWKKYKMYLGPSKTTKKASGTTWVKHHIGVEFWRPLRRSEVGISVFQ